MRDPRIKELAKLYDEYSKDSHLEQLREGNFIRLVPGRGPLDPKVMFIGEAPSKLENANRFPFYGKAGIQLTNLLLSCRIDPDHVFYTNIVKYWPRDWENFGSTRKPTAEELSISREYIMREIEIVNPDFVGLCGFAVLKTLFPEKESIAEDYAYLIDGKFIPLYHPMVVEREPDRWGQVKFGYRRLAQMIKEKESSNRMAS